MKLSTIFHFGEFRFDARALMLTRGRRTVEVSPKALQVLAVLVRNAGRVVSKDDLLETVWPDAVVEEGNLSVHVHALRGALGGRYIETAPKRGYRFAAEVSAVQGDSVASVAEHFMRQQTAEGCRMAAAELGAWIAREPGDARAKAGLANTLLFRFVLGDLGRDAALERAKTLLNDAERIEPACAEVQVSRSRWLCLAEWEWERAQEKLEYARELSGGGEVRHVVDAWRGCYLVEHGDVEEGLRRLHGASEGCPLSPFLARFLADGYFLARDFAGCAEASRRALAVHPHCWMLYRSSGRALTALGEFGEARRQFRRARLLYGAPEAGLAAEAAHLDAIAGGTVRSELRGSKVGLARVHAAMGDRGRALECLEAACANREWELASLRQDYRFDGLRGEARFQRVLAKVGI